MEDETWYEFRERIAASAGDFENWARRITSKRGLPEDKVADALKLMAALHQRVEQRPDLATEINRVFPRGGRARSIVTELAWLRERETRALRDLIADFVLERVVRRHSWVAMQKFRRQKDYTFLFEARDGRLARKSNYLPVPTTPRLSPATQFLADLHLLSPQGLALQADALLKVLS